MTIWYTSAGTEVTTSLPCLAGTLNENGSLAKRSLQSELIHGKDGTTSLKDPVSGTISQAKGTNL